MSKTHEICAWCPGKGKKEAALEKKYGKDVIINHTQCKKCGENW